MKPCASILLPVDCPAHAGCAFSQSAGACVALAAVAASRHVCAAEGDCTVTDTFCNMDYGTKGYCQSCLPLRARGSAVCSNDTAVAGSGAKMCAAACFGR